MSKYKLPKHVRNFIKSELYNYEFNKKKLQEMQDDILHATGTSDGQPKGNGTSDTTYNKVEKLITSRSILIVTDKINKIEQLKEEIEQAKAVLKEFDKMNKRQAETGFYSMSL